MGSILLTEQERDRFVMWLENNAFSNAGIIEQMEKMGGAGPMAALAKQKRNESAACLLIAKLLRNTHFETIG